MYIYIIVFLVSCSLIALSNKISNKFFKKIIEIIAVLIPCILAGLRALSVGTDVQVYVEPLFNLASKSDSFLDYLKMSWYRVWTYKYVADFELLFNIMVYIITKLTHNIQWILFTIQILIIFPIYYGIKKFKQLKNKEWLAMLCFYLLFYNISYNAMRQFISIAILFWGTSCLINEKKGDKKFFLSLILGYFFHKSALLGIVIFVIYKILKKKSKTNLTLTLGNHKILVRKIALLLIIFLSIIFIFNSSILINILELIGLNYYVGYINGNVYFSIGKLIKYVPIILIIIFEYKQLIKNENSYFYILMFILDILISYFSTVNIYAVRIGYFFQIFNIILFPILIGTTKYQLNKIINYVIILLYLGTYWYYNFVIMGANETIPYLLFK